MRIQAQVRSIEYYVIDIEVPDDADEDAQREAVRNEYYSVMMSPDDTETEIGDINVIPAGGWWGICCPNVDGEMEVLRDSETGEPALYVDRDNADEECEEINQSTDGGYFVCECDGDGNVVGAEIETPEEVTA
jgi:hypothetical protein